MENSAFLDNVTKLETLLDEARQIAGDSVCMDLSKIVSDMPRIHKAVMNQDRDLKLGIVGRVKAGKSSFLNALLFNGEEWLPKAATPMTAALTRIVHTSDKPKMIVHYYLNEDWKRWLEQTRTKEMEIAQRVDEEIERRKANPLRYRLPLDEKELLELKSRLVKEFWDAEPVHIRAGRELTQMAGNMTHGKLPGKYTDSTCNEKIDEVEVDVANPNQLRASIHKYVGANGEYTPFVSYIELQLNDERLDGLQIVDTPGLDDPVASRVAVTQDFMKECDAALLLSSVSHFLGGGDMALLTEKMQDVARAYIIGTMMDAGVLEYSDRQADLQTAYSNSRDNFSRHAASTLKDAQKVKKLPGKMSESDEPEYVSSMFHSIANKLEKDQSGKTLTLIEDHILKQFKSRFKDFKDMMSSPRDFKEFGAFDGIRERIYEPIYAEKEALKQERMAKFEKSQALAIATELEYLLQVLNSRKEEIESTDAGEIKSKMAALDKALNDSNADIMRVFANIEQRVAIVFNASINNLNSAMLEYEVIDEEIEIEEYVETYSSFLGLKKDYIPGTRRIRKASTPRAAKQLSKFVASAKSQFENNVIRLLDVENTSNQIIDILRNAFKMVDYNPPKGKIEKAAMDLVKDLNKPVIDFSIENSARNMLLGKFSGEAQGKEVDDLLTELGNQLRSINENITRQINTKKEDISENLHKASLTFNASLKKELHEHYGRLERELANKRESLARIDALISKIEASKCAFVQGQEI